MESKREVEPIRGSGALGVKKKKIQTIPTVPTEMAEVKDLCRYLLLYCAVTLLLVLLFKHDQGNTFLLTLPIPPAHNKQLL